MVKAVWRDVLTQVILVAVAATVLGLPPLWPWWFPLSDEPGAVALAAKYMYPTHIAF